MLSFAKLSTESVTHQLKHEVTRNSLLILYTVNVLYIVYDIINYYLNT